MKKLISFIVPCYNSESYMDRSVRSLLAAGDEAEILIIDDGSSDGTYGKALEYQEKYPGMVRAIHKENGGHGSGINEGLKLAGGEYFKVVDSDDWADPYALLEMLDVLRKNKESASSGKEPPIDMMITNFVYDKVGAKKKSVMKYPGLFPKNKIFRWKDLMKIRKGKYLLMHSVTYRTQVLRRCGIVLPEHTFYVDNLYVYQPLPFVRHMYYLDVDLYHYYIGREDQSVNEEVMIERIDQQILVNKLLIESYDLYKDIYNTNLRRYMFNYLEILTVVSTVLLLRSGTGENYQKKKELWRYLRKYNLRFYVKMRNGIMGILMNLPGKQGRMMTVLLYRIAQRIVGFN